MALSSIQNPSKEDMERSAWWIFTLVMLLLSLGLIMVYSTSAVKSERGGGTETMILLVQLVKIAAALGGMLLMLRTDYMVLARYSRVMFLATLALLVIVLLPIPGLCPTVNHADRWFRLGGFMVQPSEFAKLGLMILLADMIVRAGKRIEHLYIGFLPPVLLTGLVCLLILIEPDFGTCVLTGCLAVIVLVIGGARIRHFLYLLPFCLLALYFLAYSRMDHVQYRFWSFFTSPPDQVKAGLQALGSGGIFGEGLGNGLAKLYFVPLCQNDFIFSIIGEELGFLGASGILVIYLLLIYHGGRVLFGIENRFGFLLALGILLLIATQAMANMAVVLGVAPAKGIALPFVSTGGSSMMVLMMGVGILLRIARDPGERELPPARGWRLPRFDSGIHEKHDILARFLRKGGIDDRS